MRKNSLFSFFQAAMALILAQVCARADLATNSATADTFIISAAATSNAGGHDWFDAGTDGGNLGSPGVRRALLRFDLGGIPAGSTITSAVLQLTLTKVPGSLTGPPVDSVMDLFRVNASWGEGSKVGPNGTVATAGEATWNDRMQGSAAWTSPGATSDAASTASASTFVSGLGLYEWGGAGMIADVQAWIANPSENFGWLLRSQDEVGKTVRGFASRQALSGSPRLVIGYTLPPSPISNPIAERVPKGGIVIELDTLADGMASPVGMAVPDDGSGRFFVYDQDGKVWVVNSAGRLAVPLLDMASRLVLLGAYDERGLLGFAAHPDFAQNPFVYTYTSEPNSGSADFPNGLGATNNHQSVIAEWRISAGNSNTVDLATRREILRIEQPQSNHNGGAMHFGPDGLLYITLGDGGQANDLGLGHVPGGNAQDLNRVWGKMIRIDVAGSNSANGKYGIPAGNPFVGQDGIDEIFAYGLRNPFSFSFDRQTGDLYLTDVGQNRVEEVNIITAGGNYGWNIREASFWFDSATGQIVTAPVRPVPPDLVDPIAQYDHDDGLAVIGGFVYRGSAIPELAGRYVFGDWGSFAAPSGRLFYLDATNGVKELVIGWEDRQLRMWLKAFGQGPDGELYVLGNRWLGPSGMTGRLMKIVPAATGVEFERIEAAGTNIVASWSGGAGPFSFQRRRTVDDVTWANDLITNLPSAVSPQAGASGFFRVRDAAHEPPIPLSAYLSGAAEHPPTGSPGTGLGLFVLDGNTLTFNIRYSGLAGTANNAHIHGPAPASTNAGVLINLVPFNGNVWGTSGTLSGVTLVTPAQKALILGGKTYVNVHSSSVGSGEIRGHIIPMNFQAELSGARENPPRATPGRGLANLVLVGDKLTFNVTYRNLTAAASDAHIHGPAGPNGNASVIEPLGSFNGPGFGTNGLLSGTVTLTPQKLAMLVDGLTYLNVHTPTYPPGEIRGQILPQPTAIPFTTLMSGLAERPIPLTNAAAGSGTLSLEGDRLTFNLEYGGLSGPAVAAHIHGPGTTGQSTNVLVNLAPFNGGAFGSAGTVSGSVQLTTAQRDVVLNGLAYVNFHTEAHPGGELRGQIAPVAMMAGLSGNNERPAAVATTGRGLGTFALVRDQLTVALTYEGLSSPATTALLLGPTGLLGSSTNRLADPGTLNGGEFGSRGALSGAVGLPYSAMQAVIDGQSYINLFTTNFPAGEIRGHILR